MKFDPKIQKIVHSPCEQIVQALHFMHNSKSLPNVLSNSSVIHLSLPPLITMEMVKLPTLYRLRVKSVSFDTIGKQMLNTFK